MKNPRGDAALKGFSLVELMTVVAIVAILAMFVMSMSVRPYGANASSVSQQMAGTLSFARMRAVSTRRPHRVQFMIQSNGEAYAVVDQLSVTGMKIPSSPDWQQVQYTRLPKSIILWSAVAGVASTGQTPTQNANLPYNVIFKPDGTGTSSTIYIRDRNGSVHYHRVYIYQATGSSYARESW